MSDEHFYPPRWSAPRDPWTVGIRLSVYVVVAAVAVIVGWFVGAALTESCDDTQYECGDEIAMVEAMLWPAAALVVVIVIAALGETVLAIRRRRSRP